VNLICPTVQGLNECDENELARRAVTLAVTLAVTFERMMLRLDEAHVAQPHMCRFIPAELTGFSDTISLSRRTQALLSRPEEGG
jgi:hypothetical protein